MSNGWELQGSGWNGSYFHTTRVAASRAYAEAGITKPAQQISLMEGHDCFSITESMQHRLFRFPPTASDDHQRLLTREGCG